MDYCSKQTLKVDQEVEENLPLSINIAEIGRVIRGAARQHRTLWCRGKDEHGKGK